MTSNCADRFLCIMCFAFVACAGSAVRAASSACHDASNAIPVRQERAEAGSDFARRIESLSDRDRQLAIRSSLLAGNVPAFLRSAVPVQFRARLADGALARVTLCVLPDYLAIGSNADYLLIPMGLDTALAVASAFGFTLPTRRIVDGIYAQARLRLRAWTTPLAPHRPSFAVLLPFTLYPLPFAVAVLTIHHSQFALTPSSPPPALSICTPRSK